MNTNKREILKKLVADLYVELGSGDAVMKKLGMARTTVYRLLHEAGVVLPDRHDPELYDKRKTLRGEKKQAAVQDYIDEMPLKEIFTKYGISSASLYTAIKDAGVPRRPHGAQGRRFQGEDAKEMARLYIEDKLSQAQIATRFDCHQTVVGRVLREQGIVIDEHVKGNNHGNWAGGKTITEGGYLYVRVLDDDPMAVMKARIGYVLEHRLVMARHLGRPLTEKETVHHLDGNRKNNQISNLQLRQGKHGKGVAYKCADCGSYNIVETKIEDVKSTLTIDKPQRVALSVIASQILDLLEIHPGALAELTRVGVVDCK